MENNIIHLLWHEGLQVQRVTCDEVKDTHPVSISLKLKKIADYKRRQQQW